MCSMRPPVRRCKSDIGGGGGITVRLDYMAVPGVCLRRSRSSISTRHIIRRNRGAGSIASRCLADYNDNDGGDDDDEL